MEPMGAIVHLHVLAVFTEGTCSLLSCWTRHFQELIPQDSGAHYKVHLKRIGSANSSRGGANSSGTGSLYREAQWVAAINAKIKHVHSTLRSDILSRQRRNATNEPAYFILTDLELWKQPIPVERFLARLTQRYALRTILAASAEEGFQVAEQTSAVDGTIELVVTRWT